jgi:diguanylate cyclase (GGDEF)-like protein/PAS domain S-box-containing protein
MRPELRAVRQRYLGILAVAFAAVPVTGYWVARWLSPPAQFPPFSSWPGRSLVIFAVVWWLAAFGHVRQTLSLICARDGRAADAPGADVRNLARLHSYYWGWLCAYVIIASAFYAAARLGGPAPEAAIEWVQFLLIQLVVAVLIGMPFFMMLLTALGELVTAAGLDRIHISVESKLLLICVLTPLSAGAALMYVHWWHDAAWTAQDLLIWSVLGLLLLGVGLLGVRHLYASVQPLQALIDTYAPRPDDLSRLRPASTDEFGMLIQSLSRLGDTLTDGVRTRAVIEAISDGVAVTDETGRIILFNPAAERLLGYPASRARGMTICSLLPELRCQDGVPSPADQPQEIHGDHHNGLSIPVSVQVSRVGHGDPPRYVCLIKDLSGWNGIRQRPSETELHYRELVESCRDLIWSIDREGRWVFINGAARHIYGVEPAELIGRSAHQFTEPDYLEHERTAFQSLWDGRDWLEFESVHHDRTGALHHLHFIARSRKDPQGQVTAVTGVSRDVTEHKVHEQKLVYQASHDALTGLFNRHYLRQELERMVARVVRGGPGGVVMFLDLDQLKFVNDALGHGVGDRLLSEAAGLMKKHIREGDLLARYGGDEFTALLYNTDEEGARTVAENLRARFGEYRFLEGGNVYSLTCSIGLAAIDGEAKSADEVLARAERACNSAKNLGRNQVVLHARNERASGGAQDMAWIERIKQLIEEERFQLVYQPIAAVASGSVYDYEVLLRLVERDGHLLNPGAFLPTAERLGLSRRLDRAVVAKAVRALAEVRAAGQAVRFFINLTAASLRDETLLQTLEHLLAETRLDASLLTFEIAETAAVTDLTVTADFIQAVKKRGARVVLEHFGLGFSSFTYLKHLPVDALKIDGSYVQGLTGSVVNQVVVRSINQVAHALGKRSIAPQVENKEVLTLLRDLGVDYAQGYFVGRPEEGIGTERYIGASLQ